MSKRTYRHVLVLPSQHLVRPAGDDDFATYRNARIDMCLCYQVDDCCVLQLMMTLLCAIQPHEISEGESPYQPRPLPHHAHTHTHTHTHTHRYPWNSTFRCRCLHMLRNQSLEHECFCFAKIKSILNVFTISM